jgi:hypothetical protein
MPRRARRYYIIRGRLYELAVEELVKKAGFETDKSKLRASGITQISERTQSIHGRGGTYKADVVGLFTLPIPFTYPILLLGEVKYHNAKVAIKEAREFLGIHTDVSQYPRINTKSRNLKYAEMFNEARYNYAPVMFSANGFHRNPQALFYTHGIYFISYENSPLFADVRKRLDALLKQIETSEVKDEDMSMLYHAHSLSALSNLRSEAKRTKFQEKYNKLIEVTNGLRSYIGLLDNSVIVHVLSNKRLRRPTPKVRESYSRLLEGNYIELRNTANPRSWILGGFSMPSQFLERYVKHATKHQKPCFSELVIYTQIDGRLYPVYFKLSDDGRSKIIEQVQAHSQANAPAPAPTQATS